MILKFHCYDATFLNKISVDHCESDSMISLCEVQQRCLALLYCAERCVRDECMYNALLF